MNVILAIDTASSDLALAVRDGEGAIRTLLRVCGHDHSRLLVPAIDEILGAARAQLAGVVVVRGPGSYAGIRVGLATARALAMAVGLPVAGVTTFEAIGALCSSGEWLAVQPAGRGTFAAQALTDGRPEGPICSETVASLGASPVPIVGEGAAAIGGREVSPNERVEAALRVGAERLQTAGDSVDAVYLREPHITTPRRPLSASQPG